MDGALGIMLGLAYVVAPGSVNIETLRRGLTGGARVALAMQLGAIIGELFWALLPLAGTGLLLTHAVAQTILGIAGTTLLMYLGWLAVDNRLCLYYYCIGRTLPSPAYRIYITTSLSPRRPLSAEQHGQVVYFPRSTNCLSRGRSKVS